LAEQIPLHFRRSTSRR